jgi:hypothetical protein
LFRGFKQEETKPLKYNLQEEQTNWSSQLISQFKTLFSFVTSK